MATRDALHRLIEELPDALLPEAGHMLAAMRGGDPVFRTFVSAPEADEPLTAEDLMTIAEGEGELLRDATIPWPVVKTRWFGVRR